MSAKLLLENTLTGETEDVTDMWSEGPQGELSEALKYLGTAETNMQKYAQGRATSALMRVQQAEDLVKSALSDLIKTALDEGISKNSLAEKLGISSSKLNNLIKE